MASTLKGIVRDLSGKGRASIRKSHRRRRRAEKMPIVVTEKEE